MSGYVTDTYTYARLGACLILLTYLCSRLVYRYYWHYKVLRWLRRYCPQDYRRNLNLPHPLPITPGVKLAAQTIRTLRSASGRLNFVS